MNSTAQVTGSASYRRQVLGYMLWDILSLRLGQVNVGDSLTKLLPARMVGSRLDNIVRLEDYENQTPIQTVLESLALSCHAEDEYPYFPAKSSPLVHYLQ